MFCDLVGSTSLAARLDPEDCRQRPYLDPPTGNAPWTLRNYTRTYSALGLTMSAVAGRLDWLRRCH
jgi:hypothetical protein